MEENTIPPERGFHAGVQTEQAFVPNYMTQDIQGSSKGTFLILESRGKAFSKKLRVTELDAYLILTSSNGTTTKLSVPPALQPVKIDSFCVISFSPVSLLYVFPQKSFAALEEDCCQCSGFIAFINFYNLVARLGASSNRGGTRPESRWQCHMGE